jgi:hypothetical protein
MALTFLGHRPQRRQPVGRLRTAGAGLATTTPPSMQSAAMRIRLPSDCVELLDRQHGVLARWQAPLCGLDQSAIDAMLRAGRWQPLYRSVYAAFTGLPSRDAILWAAVRRCGPTATLSHHSAAELDGLADGAAAQIHVTIAGQLRFTVSDGTPNLGLPRIAVHRSKRIEAARHPARLPPRTRIEETALDLTQVAATLDAALAWLAAACGRRLTRPELLRQAIEPRSRLRWRAELSAALDDVSSGAHSILELRYIRDVERPHGLPTAIRQTRVRTGSRTRYLDNLYKEFGLVIELDGRAAHPADDRWRDIHRDNSLSGGGLGTLRYGWADVTSRPCQTAQEIADVLRTRGWSGQLARCPSCPSGPSARIPFRSSY